MRNVIPTDIVIDSEGYPKSEADWSIGEVRDEGRWTRSVEPEERNEERWTRSVEAEERDEESGELARQRIIILRRHPRTLEMNHSFPSRTKLRAGSHLLEDHQRFGSFRIQDFIDGLGNLNFIRQPPDDLRSSSFQTCIKLKKGVPVSYTTCLSPSEPSLGIVSSITSGGKHIFRVPVESLPSNQSDKPTKNSETICINIWEEFLFGKSVLDCGQENETTKPGPLGELNAFLSQYFSKTFVSFLACTIYFVIYFASCCAYNMFWQLGCYILLASHLQIHERAYDKKVNIEFTGSCFQGPTYIFVRNWCQHCVQKDNEKVMLNLMKKMKADITLPANR
ncbi:hypothetical protein OTU49_006011 [Cherax quadricarinatus]|uniref:Uncharacterized protein n=1 Tax=Cherax quadricarinatus TaxID=27406 RepID=A0AAW0WPB5_CHEQU|nr:uncharacterized protein LOC128694729 [Cherax quadricarinatus]